MKLLCVDNKPIEKDNPYNNSLKRLEVGSYYTLEYVTPDGNDVILKEVKSTHPLGGWNSKHFAVINAEIGIKEEVLEEEVA